MKLFEQDKNCLKVRYQGEYLWLMPWGRNALRVVARHMTPPELPDWALLPQEKTDVVIEIGEEEASIAVGKIRAVVQRIPDPPDRVTITYYNDKGEVVPVGENGLELSTVVMSAPRRRSSGT